MMRWTAPIATFAAIASWVGEPVMAQDVEEGALHVVVMDPLSAPLSCPCVQGYAQRQYEKLASHLEVKLERPVRMQWAESLKVAFDKYERAGQPRRADLIIGKDSVVRFDAKRLKLAVTPLAHLTGKDGKTEQTGLLVVREDDPAQSVADLAGYRILFGPADCDEKHAAALALLKKHGVDAPATLETAAACSAGAGALLEMPAGAKGATVISSYAQPLLEGCGTVPKGALRVIGTTEKVPFITAFATAADPDARKALQGALLAVGRSPFLMLAMETKRGFVPAAPKPVDEPAEETPAQKKRSQAPR